MPLYTDVVLTLKVTLSVPEDTIYDNESYFKALKEGIVSYPFEEGKDGDSFEEVDDIKVELLEFEPCSDDGGECSDHTKHYGTHEPWDIKDSIRPLTVEAGNGFWGGSAGLI